MPDVAILFSPEMARAYADGRKTQTRRVVTDRTCRGNWRASQLDLEQAFPDNGPSPAGNPGPYLHAPVRPAELVARGHSPDERIVDRLFPWVFAGDRVTLLSTWATTKALDAAKPSQLGGGIRFWSAFDGEKPEWAGKSRPGRFLTNELRRRMPVAEVAELRVERLQEISEKDAKAEGAVPPHTDWSHLDAFRALWDSINGVGAWRSNPFVWCLTLRRDEP